MVSLANPSRPLNPLRLPAPKSLPHCVTICGALQLPIEHWHEYLNDPTLADAIMDRLIHCSHKIHLHGKESMRERASKKAGKG